MLQLTVQGATVSALKAALLAAAADLGGKAAATEKKPAETADDAGSGLDYTNDIRPLIVKLSKDHGKEVSAEVVAKFETADGEPCTKGPEVQPKDHAALLAAVKKAQKKADVAKAAAAADDDD